jgi:putative pyruvate formate lyase activating enzyme
MPPRDPDAFIVRDFEPAYLDEAVRATLPARVERAQKELAACTACPRNCRINRLEDETKFCGIGRYARVSSAFAHSGEEDCLRGWAGSGTIFFTMCNLRCVFCQNWDISQQQVGRECDADALADLMLLLQHQGCHNINFVTPEHIVPQLVEALAAAIERGLRLPVVYNTSAYDSLESLTLMDGLVDIYMPDFKFWESESAERLCKAKDYPERARQAICASRPMASPAAVCSCDTSSCRASLMRARRSSDGSLRRSPRTRSSTSWASTDPSMKWGAMSGTRTSIAARRAMNSPRPANPPAPPACGDSTNAW